MIELSGEGMYVNHQCLEELSIMQKQSQGLGNKMSIYEQEELEDEALQMIIHPNRNT